MSPPYWTGLEAKARARRPNAGHRSLSIWGSIIQGSQQDRAAHCPDQGHEKRSSTCGGRLHPGQQRGQGGCGQRTMCSLPVWRLREKAVLRRNARQDRIRIEIRLLLNYVPVSYVPFPPSRIRAHKTISWGHRSGEKSSLRPLLKNERQLQLQERALPRDAGPLQLLKTIHVEKVA
jgi:hypothetical protein